MESKYMQWAKAAHFKYNLATSGVIHYSLKDLGIRLEDLEISGPTFYGYEPLQNGLAAKSKVEAENIVAATGTSMANHLVLAALVKPGDEVLIEHPTYDPLLAVLKYLKADIKSFNRHFENAFRVEPDLIERMITTKTRLLVLTNLHNPSGVLTDLDTLRKVGKIARSVGARVLVDEVYLEALADPSAYYAFALGNEFVTTSSLTKAYGLSGLRCGWIVADPELVKRIWHLNDLFGVTPAHTAELLSVIALRKLDQIAQLSRSLLNRNRQRLQKFFEDQQDLEVVMPSAGTIAFPRYKYGETDPFCKFLAERYETGVVPGRFFGMPAHFRIGVGCSTEVLEEGLKRVRAALQEWRKLAAAAT